MGILDSAVNVAELVEVARATLPSAAAEAWIGLLRPAVGLRRAVTGELAVGQLGGAPALPVGMEWPRTRAGRPLGFIASIDLARVPIRDLDVPLPTDGTLLLFYRDPSEDPYEVFGISDPEPEDQPPTGYVVFVPAGTQTTPWTEAGATLYPEVGLTGDLIATGPRRGHPALEQALAELSDADREFVTGTTRRVEFWDELSRRSRLPGHLLGGYAHAWQEPVEFEAAWMRLDAASPDSVTAVLGEAQHWTSLVQLDSGNDADMMWFGSLYWMMRRDDIAAARFDAATSIFQVS
ncbi:YwqG family protein [Actinoplanes sp. NPDC023801]|uniref:YwqG family protein n=1 Tax=Actinoplanes sp. NPDC023801 TaxID=3154595 RepID=UPI0033DD2E31